MFNPKDFESKLSEDYELSLAKYMFQNERFTSRIMHFLKPKHHLENKIAKWVITEIINSKTSRNSIPAKISLLTECGKDSHLDSRMKAQLTYFIQNEISEEVEDSLYAVDVFASWLTSRVQIQAMVEACKYLSGGNVDGAQRVFAEVSAINFRNDIHVSNYITDTDIEIEKRAEEEKEAVPLGIPLCQRMRGEGIHKKAITVLLAPTNVGKTTTAIHCAASAMEQGKNVLLITLETSRESARLNLDSRITHIPVDEIHSRPALVKARIHEVEERHGRNLFLAHFPVHTLKPSHLRNCLNQINAETGKDIDLLVIDSFDDMIPDEGRTGSDNKDADLIYAGIIRVADYYNVAVLGTSQSNRQAFGKEYITLADIGKAVEKVQRARCVIGLSQTEDQASRSRPEFTMHLLKNSWGKKGFQDPVFADFHIQRISYPGDDFNPYWKAKDESCVESSVLFSTIDDLSQKEGERCT